MACAVASVVCCVALSSCDVREVVTSAKSLLRLPLSSKALSWSSLVVAVRLVMTVLSMVKKIF